MCRTTRWWLTQTKLKRCDLPGEFFRRPVRWVMARGPDGMPVRLQHAQRVIQLPVDSYRGDYPLCTPSNTRLMLQAPDRESVINVFNAVVEESQLSHRLRATV
jgi:hypothetical protein